MKRKTLAHIILLVSCFSLRSFSQESKPIQVALFVSLQLDSAFDASNNYTYGRSFPKGAISGLEFYQGALFALDSLEKTGSKIRFHVFDIKSEQGKIKKISSLPVMDSIQLIIGQVSGTDYLQLAGLAERKKIPFISATYPNDGGVKNNPYVFIVNPKLNSHIQLLFNYLNKNQTNTQIILFKRTSTGDNRIPELFEEYNRSSSTILRYQTKTLEDNFNAEAIIKELDSTKENIIVAGSLDENFGRNILNASTLIPKSYAISLYGMPTWESIKELSRNELKLVPVIYTTSFFNTPDNRVSNEFEENYRKKTFSRPSDIAYRGYELTWYFCKLIETYGSTLSAHLNTHELFLITDFDFRPIFWSKNSSKPDYYENKRIYLIKRLNGIQNRLY
ncbi:MAG: ABC transporter substrate-binding protein [Chitinophagaceae bacterium]